MNNANKFSKLLINFGPLKKGGGQNVALNFLQELERYQALDFEPYFIACNGSILHQKLNSSKWSNNILTVSRNPYFRIIQELTLARLFLKRNNIKNVYSYFGFAFFGPGVNQVIGSADSNLYFPEINFWSNEKLHEKLIRSLVDKYRIWGLKRAAAVIYENKEMYVRAETLFGIKKKALILPSIDTPTDNKNLQIEYQENTFKVLLLCGWQRNKNILCIPELAHNLKASGYKFEFIITTAPDKSSCSKDFFNLVDMWQVQDMINCIGQVEKSQLKDLYMLVDSVLLLSLLESFSNNIIEAWFYKKPLIVADEAWSRAICSDAAFYVQRDSIKNISEAITQIHLNSSIQENLILAGREELQKFPSINERFCNEINFLKESLS